MPVEKLKPNGTASAKRQKELRQFLFLLSQHTTKSGTLTALAGEINVQKHRLSNWIKQGYVPPANAAKLLKLKGVRVDNELIVTLEQLTPILF